ncbi:hypothetical protein ACSBR1_019005 [Camellia fascicularis]
MKAQVDTSISRCTYHMFLSFKGKDTRKAFTDHLYTALVWCLDKLLMILEFKRTSKHIVLPIFYDVDPAEVKNQTGGLAEDFVRHEQIEAEDQVDQLDALIGIRDWFHPGSKVIITTRHERLLQPHKDHEVHNVEKLDEDESCELFSWHAFGQNHPIKVFMEHSKRVVQYCGGLLLALQVLGSSLSEKSVDVWESALEKLETIPQSQIVNKLKISYDSLRDDHDKNLFLHIACFFVGMDKDFSVRILD